MSQQNEMIKNDPAKEMEEIDLLELFFYLRSKIVWLIIAFIVGAVIAGGYTKLLITPKYQATAKLYMVSASSDSIVDLTDLNLGTSLSEDYQELLKIRPIFEEVIDELELDYTYDQLLNMTSIGTIGKTRIIAITVTSTSKAEARDVANALADKAVTYIPDLMETSKPNIAERAILPEHKCSPSLAKNTVIGALLAFILLAGIFTVKMLMDDTLKCAEDVEKQFGVMPLTVIPEGDMKSSEDKGGKETLLDKKKKKGAK